MAAEVREVYELLYAAYGDLNWWPADSPYEVIVGAILTQNTAWTNVEKAFANFPASPDPHNILALDHEGLTALIRPAGYHNQKARYLQNITEWYRSHNFDTSKVQDSGLETIRKDLLNTKGIGPETADSILLYAFEFPTFVVDAYTVRLCQRYPILTPNYSYAKVKSYFEANLPVNTALYNNYHALIVKNGNTHCRKRPICTGCPLDAYCAKIGVEQPR